MHPDRIAELLDPFLADSNVNSPHKIDRLNNDDLSRISIYIDLLKRWNSHVNLTAIRSDDEIVTRHFGESLFAARHLFPGREVSSQKSSLADLGSGAGFPGIPIKLWAPEIALTLIESNHKKVAFLREACRALTLTDVDVQNVRAKDISQKFDVATLRAVERFADILPIAARLLAPRGRLVLLISQAQFEPGFPTLHAVTWKPPLAIPGSESRILLTGLDASR
jgi:16S rRNA (guanine527-N7)-methyltransferase